MTSELLRVAVVVPDVEPEVSFYRDVFGWSVLVDSVYGGDTAFPPVAGPVERSEFRIIYLTDDGKTPRLGLMSYLDPPFDVFARQGRRYIGNGDIILAVRSSDIAAVSARAAEAGGTVVNSPAERTYTSLDGATRERILMASVFDPVGIYIEVHQELASEAITSSDQSQRFPS